MEGAPPAPLRLVAGHGAQRAGRPHHPHVQVCREAGEQAAPAGLAEDRNVARCAAGGRCRCPAHRLAVCFTSDVCRQYPRTSVWHRVKAPIRPGKETVVNGDCSFGWAVRQLATGADEMIWLWLDCSSCLWARPVSSLPWFPPSLPLSLSTLRIHAAAMWAACGGWLPTSARSGGATAPRSRLRRSCCRRWRRRRRRSGATRRSWTSVRVAVWAVKVWGVHRGGGRNMGRKE